METKRTNKNNVGNAGEYYMAARLSAENFIATITLGRAERYDILAVSPKGRTVKISVKTRYDIKYSPNIFWLGKKDENKSDTDSYYAFVRLKEFKGEPDFWIVPASVVAKITKKSYKHRIEGESVRKETKRKDTTIRNFHLKKVPGYPGDREKQIEKYKGNIGLLK
ncbi:MAG: hypothetical protein CO170_03095 [candidate division SR1 bacterium CG_4_9_14_3_um_filter_40_9]|nr:MAG: hypothetical protein CO170_03095 [candidate division SR1 bacterium CG_4_9_14_3_um_filter_40_9]